MRLPSGAIRSQFIDVNDVTPTVYDLLGIAPPPVFDGVTQMPMHGASFRAVLSSATAPPPRDRQVYELRGNRAIWHDGWKAVTIRAASGNYDDDEWQLFDLRNDPAEAINVAGKHRIARGRCSSSGGPKPSGGISLSAGRGRGGQ